MACLVLLVLSVWLYIFTPCDSQTRRMDVHATVPKLIVEAGYPSESHRVTTPDGYSLQMHRIPAGRRTARRTDTGGKGKRAVFIQHGMMGSSGDFVIMGPERSLAFLLADAGYDVWLGNLRGTVYSTHENLTRNDPEFWEYSFHEHGKYDVPAMIDTVLAVTGQRRVLYVGYSMGTTSFFTMMALRPEYNDKVVAFAALAPAVYIDSIKDLANMLLRVLKLTQTMRERSMFALSFRPDFLSYLFGQLCAVPDPRNNMCLSFIYSVVGEDYEQDAGEIVQIAMARIQPASLRQLEHFGKIAIKGVFTAWEDGLDGAVKPYNISNVRVPVVLLYGKNDLLTSKKGTMRLAKELKENGVLEEVISCPWPKFNHLDFVFAKDVAKILNRPLVKLLGQLFNKYDSVSV